MSGIKAFQEFIDGTLAHGDGHGRHTVSGIETQFCLNFFYVVLKREDYGIVPSFVLLKLGGRV